MTTRYIFSFTEPIRPDDLLALFEQTSWANNRSPLDIQLMLDRSHFTLGVWDEDHLIGFARVITDDRYRALIDDVVVDSAYRKQGIASQMLDKMLKRLQHIEAIVLECGPELESFYSRFGFERNDSSSLKLKNDR
ncbi:MAG: GNAT family N-acetyltransferase [Chloroflexi bacterium]|nr:GNAT family N-acetyltransferase [Chloroflexota bacterium]